MMGWGEGMMGYGGGFFGGLLMLLFWALIILGIVFLVKWFVGQGREDRSTGVGDDSLEIIKKRYARGEIDKEEFEEKKKALTE